MNGVSSLVNIVESGVKHPLSIIGIAGSYLHVMTNNPTKYEQILSYCFRGVVFSKCHRRRPLLCHSVLERQGTKNI
jgi:hypothetical protein